MYFSRGAAATFCVAASLAWCIWICHWDTEIALCMALATAAWAQVFAWGCTSSRQLGAGDTEFIVHDLKGGGVGAGVCLGLQLLGAAGRGRHGRAALARRRRGAVGHAGAQPLCAWKRRSKPLMHGPLHSLSAWMVPPQVSCGGAVGAHWAMPLRSPVRITPASL